VGYRGGVRSATDLAMIRADPNNRTMKTLACSRSSSLAEPIVAPGVSLVQWEAQPDIEAKMRW
jgi:hypothetical protein